MFARFALKSIFVEHEFSGKMELFFSSPGETYKIIYFFLVSALILSRSLKVKCSSNSEDANNRKGRKIRFQGQH